MFSKASIPSVIKTADYAVNANNNYMKTQGEPAMLQIVVLHSLSNFKCQKNEFFRGKKLIIIFHNK